MKKTVCQFLTQQKTLALNNQFSYSANYLMTKAAPGYEEEFAEAQRDVEIIEELLLLVEDYPTSDDPDVTPVLQYCCTAEEIKTAQKAIQDKTLNPENCPPDLLETARKAAHEALAEAIRDINEPGVCSF